MKIKKTTIIEDNYTIDYENGISCNISFRNSKLKLHQFFKTTKKIRLYPVTNITELKDTHFSDHFKIAVFIKFKTLEDFKQFDDFNNLYYIGGSTDGYLQDRFGNHISSILRLDDSFCSINAKIETPEQVAEVYDKIKDHPWIRKIEKVEIPYYNQYDGHTHSLCIEIKPDSDILNKAHSKFTGYASDQVKLESLNYMLDAKK